MQDNSQEDTDSPAGVAGLTCAATLPEDGLLDAVQRATFRFFWEGSHPLSHLAPDRRVRQDIGTGAATPGPMAVGGTGFAIMAHLVAAERGWVSRAEALARIGAMVELLWRAPCYHGAWPHFMEGASGATIPFSRKDDGGDLVETSYLCMGLLCARQYFYTQDAPERRLRERITVLWEEVEWSWYTRGGRPVLHWHWSPRNGWALEHEIRGWNECLITYVLAASAPRHPVPPVVYHRGFAAGRDYLNGGCYHGIRLPLGPAGGGPLFFAHYSFCGLDPRGLADAYADYWEQNVHHARINRAHCIANPHQHKGYGAGCWGLTACDGPDGYAAHDPQHDTGTIAPTAALSSYPYLPGEALFTLRHLLTAHGARIYSRWGFTDAFNEARGWCADSFLAIDQGPIIVMIENYRSALLWRLFMSVPEVRAGLKALGFTSPWLAGAAP
jgi:hypothetical protein